MKEILDEAERESRRLGEEYILPHNVLMAIAKRTQGLSLHALRSWEDRR